MNMLGNVVRVTAVAAVGFGLFTAPVRAQEPVELRFAYWLSGEGVDWVNIYQPWIERVEADSEGTLRIRGYTGGILGRDLAAQLRMMEDGVADIVYPVAAYTPGRFPDNEFTELPGLFESGEEASTVIWKLYERGLLRGFEGQKVLALFGSPPFTFHTRSEVVRLEQLEGKKIRAAGKNAIAAVESLGASAVGMNMVEMAEALSRGVIDGVAMHFSAVRQNGADDMAKYHYVLPMWSGHHFMTMKQEKFDSLPEQAKEAIENHTGVVLSAAFGIEQDTHAKTVEAEWREPGSGHVVTVPSDEDMAVAQAKFEQMYREWVGDDEHRAKIMEAVREEIEIFRANGG